MNNTKRLLTLLLLVCGMTMGAWALEQDGDGYYLLGSVQDWQDFATLVETTPSAKARLTADISLGDDQTKIGSVSTPYQGTFDGQGYSLTVAYVETDASSEYVAPFIRISYATIQNLHVKGSVTTAGKGPAGLTSQVTGQCYVRNCWSEVDITSSYDGDIGAGGLVARVIGTGDNIYMDDCIFSGSITFSHSNGRRAAGLVGYCPSASTGYIKNCLSAPQNISTIKTDDHANRVLVGNYFIVADIPIINCYYVNAGTSSSWRAQGKEAQSSQLADGFLAYKLQAFREDIIWGQKLGTDALPVPLATDERCLVYRASSGGFTNNAGEGHIFHPDTDGYYPVGTLADWQDFATMVEINQSINAKMTADIDLGDDQTVVATSNDFAYGGTFDGQGHTITVNLTATKSHYGLFCTLKGGTIKNLHVTGTVTTTYGYTGGIVGLSHGLTSRDINTITNCRSSVTMRSSAGGTGGLVGGTDDYDTLNMIDCLFDGSFDGVQTSNWGGFLGNNYYSTVNITNSLFAPTSINIKDGLYPFFTTGKGGCTLTNCYTAVQGNTTQGILVTEGQVIDGTVTTALQNEREETVWVQDPLTNQPMLALFAGKYIVPASGLGTFSAKANFTLPEGLEAYYCKNYDSTEGAISVVAINGVVPAETGVLLKGTPGETYTLTSTNAIAGEVTDNALVAVTEQTNIAQTVDINNVNYTNFGLSGGVFKKVNANGGTVKANRAYLHIPTSALNATAQARGISLVWIEDVTSIREVHGSRFKVQDDGAWFTLDGRRLNGKPTGKGLYIMNGKKVVINLK